MLSRFWLALLILPFCLCCLSLQETCGEETQLEQMRACRYCRPPFDFVNQLQPSASGRQYAPDRKVDLLHLRLDVTPDLEARTVAGTCVLQFEPIARPLSELTLGAVDLNIQSVEANVPLADHEMTTDGLEIAFDPPVEPGKRVELRIAYSAEPRRGLYFRTPELGFRNEDTHIWTQGEPHESRHWFPSIDYPNERFTSEIICHLPEEFTILSNGRLLEEVREANGMKRAHYLQDKPHVAYLIALVAGKFSKLEGRYKDIPLRFFTPQSRAPYAANGFRDTADVLQFLEEELGVPYPWAKYDQVVVEDYHIGGMENTSLTVLNPIAVFPNESENLRDLYGLIAHELVHQWFGDLVTCKDWSELYLNEGFAVYYSYLYDGYKNGNDALLHDVYNDRKGILYNKDEKRAITHRQYNHAWDQFDQRAYAKGGWILHMLRTQLGEDLFRRAVTPYLNKNALRSVDTHDLQQAFEEVSGLSLLPFFDQWVHHGGHPDLKVTYDWLPGEKLAKVSVQQRQAATQSEKDKKEASPLFDLPLTLRFVGPEFAIDREVLVDKAMQDFYVPLPGKPDIVRFDAKTQVLGSIEFNKPKEMLYAQLARQDDVVGRLLAADALSDKDDRETIERLQAALQNDPFFGVRLQAAKALADIGSLAALEALIDSRQQSDARVRRHVVRALGSFFHPMAKTALLQFVAEEQNPDIIAEAIRPLGKYPGGDVSEQITRLLQQSSYDNAVAVAAMDAARAQEDPSFLPLMQASIRRDAEFPSKTFAGALDAVAYLGKDLDDRREVREFLTSYLNHPREPVRLAALGALGTLGDPATLDAVRAFHRGPKGDRKKKAAGEALKKIREKQKTSESLGALREQVDTLREENETFRKDVQELKDRLESANEGAESQASEEKAN
ncbi:MAG: M1 family aminopeptidase [Planctomycetota bacterium]|nr:M1 family aminopeptidase [Planctomycetota bacterium]